MPSSIRVLVVDDYEPFRRFICSTLESRPDLQVVGEATDGLEAVRKPRNATRFDLAGHRPSRPKWDGSRETHLSKSLPAQKSSF